jgi:hypothetical protein
MVEKDKSVPDEIASRLNAWQFYFKWWYFLHYFFGVMSIVPSLTVTYMAFVIPKTEIIALLSLIAAISTALNYFLMPYKCAKGYVQGWRILSAAIIEYKTDEKVDIKVLHKAILDGEEKIANQYQ